MSVVNIKRSQPYNVYIGRANRTYNHEASQWANPFVMDEWHTREDVLGLYYWHLVAHPELYYGTKELRGKILGCYCSPLPCHGDLLTWLSDGETLPDLSEPHNWQECQYCGAPFVFWKKGHEPTDLYAYATDRSALFNPRHYTHINGTRPDEREVVGCMTCGTVGLYALGPQQLRSGSLSLYADQVLAGERVLREKTTAYRQNTRRR